MKRYCATAGCYELVTSGHCPTHRRVDQRRRAEKSRLYGYRRSNWRRVRAARLALANFECELKLRGCTGVATHVHLDPLLSGQHDRARLEDARACCASGDWLLVQARACKADLEAVTLPTLTAVRIVAHQAKA